MSETINLRRSRDTLPTYQCLHYFEFLLGLDDNVLDVEMVGVVGNQFNEKFFFFVYSKMIFIFIPQK